MTSIRPTTRSRSHVIAVRRRRPRRVRRSPHRDPAAAAAFAIGEFDIATIPSLPGRSIVETMLGQATVGLAGLGIDASGLVAIDDRNAPGVASSDVASGALLDTDGFAGFQRSSTWRARSDSTAPQ